MTHIVEYRSDQAPSNEYPRRIVSPLAPSPCCLTHMTRVGENAMEATWRFYYKRCEVCGYTVRYFYAPRLMAIFEAGRQIRIALAEMNLGAGVRKRRTRAELVADRAAAQRWSAPMDSWRTSAVPVRARHAGTAGINGDKRRKGHNHDGSDRQWNGDMRGNRRYGGVLLHVVPGSGSR